MTKATKQNSRVVSGMRPTGGLHLGNYHGALKNWVKLQREYECFYFVADWHALTTDYDDPSQVGDNTWEMIIDWLAAGLNPAHATLFIQSRVPEHAELNLLFAMLISVTFIPAVLSRLRVPKVITRRAGRVPPAMVAEALGYRDDWNAG